MPRVDRHLDYKGVGTGAGIESWTEASYRRPTPEAVALLQATHGLHACLERWGFIPRTTIEKMVTQGKKLLRTRA